MVDIQPSGAEDTVVKIVENTAAQLGSNHTVYAALSYCWGEENVYKSAMLRMTKSNVAEMATGILLSDLPEVFRDAITTTRFLGIRYLWIDALCIAQGDREEWETESLKVWDPSSRS